MPHVRVDDIDLHYEERGAGEPLVFLSPTGWPGTVWQLEQVDFFSRHYRVLTYDYRGVGQSGKPDQSYSTAQMAADLAGLLRATSAVPAHVVGFSIGGRAAQLLAIGQPSLFRTLILAGSDTGRPGGGKSVPAHLALALLDESYGSLEFWIEHFEDAGAFSPGFLHSDGPRRLAETIRQGQPPAKLYLRHVLARLSHYSGDRLNEIRVPVQVLVGAEDRSGAGEDRVAAARQLAGQIANAELETIPGGWHLFPWEVPAPTNEAILRFVRQH